ncbi:MAG TPA: hypothetical protein VF054_20905 [Micromonosporaceae bacterium]
MSDLDAVLGDDRDAPFPGGFDEFDERQPSRARRRRALAGAMVVLLILLIVVGAVFGPTEWRLFQARGIRVDTPKQVAGLTVDDNADAADTADYLRTVLDARMALTATTGAVYQDGTGNADRSVIVIGGRGLASNPGHRLDVALDLISDEAGAVTGVHRVPAGPLGGVMKCGTTATDGGGSMTVCGWADYGSVALVLLPGRTVDDGATLTRDLRAGVEHRS